MSGPLFAVAFAVAAIVVGFPTSVVPLRVACVVLVSVAIASVGSLCARGLRGGDTVDAASEENEPMRMRREESDFRFRHVTLDFVLSLLACQAALFCSASSRRSTPSIR